ncbi:hypothetical protein Aab01nite_14710 [Paractinoplanes abujensis]|uniref:Uncharacterized protein n=1 Tax=Paractinoplanes abujensis TaxID=882441 RepID=A0A7W7CLF6_9ACTN|nr:hypothetical protein [Actinoplanes abujensis]MBB4690706.1 hypothetical protein [Actinoplanes abujensis]GID17881.1 hypothetical protein Aab01nite_14710 [Actinoplanes abujensis]
MPVSVNLDALLDEPFRDLAIGELINAPVAALAGVSDEEAQGLSLAFGINTIADLAANPFIRAAVAIAEMAGAAAPPEA